MSFKQELELNFIPRIRKMIQLEEQHLEAMLQSTGSSACHFCKESRSNLAFLKKRLTEYIEFSKK